MRTHTTTTIHRADKLLAVRRLAAGKTTTKSLAKKYRTTEGQVKSWVTQHKNDRLIKRNHSMWNPSWDLPNTTIHPMDEDILVGIKKGRPTYEDSIISLLDPEVDPLNGVTHVEWTDDQIDRMLLWMVDRALCLIRDVAIATDEFKEEYAFIQSPMFSAICKALGYDADVVRDGVDNEIAKRKKAEENEIL